MFASDRSHMLKEDKVTYMAPQPPYPPICNESKAFFLCGLSCNTSYFSSVESTNNINEFINIKSNAVPGDVMNLTNFRRFLDV